MVRETLDRWDANPAQDFVDLQIARLEAALRPLEQKIAAGDVSVVDKFVKVLGLLGKYHDAQLQMTGGIEDGGDREAAFIEWLERLAPVAPRSQRGSPEASGRARRSTRWKRRLLRRLRRSR
jgi:hypothetical protein